MHLRISLNARQEGQRARAGQASHLCLLGRLPLRAVLPAENDIVLAAASVGQQQRGGRRAKRRRGRRARGPCG
jgi:hypothetical protein